MTPIRCKGCGRVFAWSKVKDVEARIYCSPLCAEDMDLTPNVFRDDLVAEVARIPGVRLDDLGEWQGVSKQRIHQILKP